MKRRVNAALLCVAALLAALALGACGAEEELDVPEGEPVELGNLHYNVQLTRFLNPDDTADAAYLEEQRPAPPGKQYLGVFLRIENEGSTPAQIAEHMTIVDTRGNEFEPVDSDNPFALELGRTIEPHGELPEPGSPAAAGPVKGALLLFLVDEAVTENRPLELEIPGEDETGFVELDI